MVSQSIKMVKMVILLKDTRLWKSRIVLFSGGGEKADSAMFLEEAPQNVLEEKAHIEEFFQEKGTTLRPHNVFRGKGPDPQCMAFNNAAPCAKGHLPDSDSRLLHLLNSDSKFQISILIINSQSQFQI